MNIEVNLDRKQSLVNSDERLIAELEDKARFIALEEKDKLPSLTDILYGVPDAINE